MRRKGILIMALALFLSTFSGAVAPLTSPPAQALALADDYAGLYDLITAAQATWNHQGFFPHFGRDLLMAPGAPEMTSDSNAPADRGAMSHSQTNIQVQGVDEADIIKTDGEYLYLIANDHLIIVDARNPSELAILTSIPFEAYRETDELLHSETPLELYLDSEASRLTLIASGFKAEKSIYDGGVEPREPVAIDESGAVEPGKNLEQPVDDSRGQVDPVPANPADSGRGRDGQSTPGQADSSTGFEGSAPVPEPEFAPETDREFARPDIWYYYRNEKQYVTTYVYDISDRSNPLLVRQLSQEGYYLSSRRIGSAVYVVSNTYTYWLMPMQEGIERDEQGVFPSFTEGDPMGVWQTVPANRIAVVPEGDVNHRMTLTAIDTVNQGSKPDVLSVLGSSGTVYSSSDYLYVATWHADWKEDSNWAPVISTDVYRFRLNAGAITIAGQGRVPGSIINQFAMDEHNGYFRIATTTGEVWTNDAANRSKNNLYVLDDNLNIIGQVTGLAPGESIKSVRFMGDQAYVVTFRTVDPLFVIDLSRATTPTVLGELKIPGYSTYLHPYDEGLLLGFGYDVAVEGDNAYNLGMKISLFDISNFHQPREVSTLMLGGIGSHADILYNHKSLLFSRELNLIAFPAMLTERTGSIRSYSMPVFQGLLVLTVDESNQLQLRGQVSHIEGMSNPESRSGELTEKEAEAFWYNQIQRAAYIDSTLLTISSREVRATDLHTLKTFGGVELPGYQVQPGYFYYEGVVRVDVEFIDDGVGNEERGLGD